MGLLPPLITQHQHRQYLRQRGLSPEQMPRLLILRACYRTGRSSAGAGGVSLALPALAQLSGQA